MTRQHLMPQPLSVSIDPTLPKFRNWLSVLGATEYFHRFLDAGYDLPFIAKQGLDDSDLDCIGIPMSKLGLRKKIKVLHRIEEFYSDQSKEDAKGGDDEDEDEDGEEEEDDEDEEEEEEEEDD